MTWSPKTSRSRIVQIVIESVSRYKIARTVPSSMSFWTTPAMTKNGLLLANSSRLRLQQQRNIYHHVCQNYLILPRFFVNDSRQRLIDSYSNSSLLYSSTLQSSHVATVQPSTDYTRFICWQLYKYWSRPLGRPSRTWLWTDSHFILLYFQCNNELNVAVCRGISWRWLCSRLRPAVDDDCKKHQIWWKSVKNCLLYTSDAADE